MLPPRGLRRPRRLRTPRPLRRLVRPAFACDTIGSTLFHIMSQTVTEQPATSPTGGDWESSRRDKLRRIAELGRDPWGQRFDDHASIASIRARASEVVLQLQDGKRVALPDPTAAGADFDFRKWLSEQGTGEIVGPEVRAAGRIVLHRDKGKLQFIDIRDMTGQIQLF